MSGAGSLKGGGSVRHMDIGTVREFLGKDWTDVQELISGVLKSDIELLNVTNGSILSHGGKQLRPMLSLLVSRACLRSADTYVPGQELSPLQDVSKRYAAASELLHNATLLHDDVADDSDMRRGNPTVRSVLGSSASVLVGDFWLVRAIRLILGENDASCDPKVVRIFSRTLSCLAEGEMLQLQKAQTADTDYDDYLRIIYSKTASLFEAAAVTAAISVNASGMCREAVRDYAVSLGYAFQIKDDILDYCGTDSVGKPLGVDILEQKITLPLLGAIANAPEHEAKVRAWVRDIPECQENRTRIVSFVVENHGVEYAEKQLDGFVGKAVDAISLLAPSAERELLAELARFTAIRNN